MNTKNKHIQTAIKNHYGAFGDNLDHYPISRTDVEIINELVELLKKYGITEVNAIMQNYKKDPDYEVVEKLIGINTEFNPIIGEGEQEEKKPKNIVFEDKSQFRMKVYDVHNYKPVINENKYAILINEVSELVTKTPSITVDKHLYYRDEETRDSDIERLDYLKE